METHSHVWNEMGNNHEQNEGIKQRTQTSMSWSKVIDKHEQKEADVVSSPCVRVFKAGLKNLSCLGPTKSKQHRAKRTERIVSRTLDQYFPDFGLLVRKAESSSGGGVRRPTSSSTAARDFLT